jgi:hypothetical protein
MAILNYRDPNTLEWVPVSGSGLDQTLADSLYVSVGGDLMTGPLVLSGDPVNAMDAATKNYVDAGRWTEAATDLLYVKVTGGTITGNLVVQGTTTLTGAALGGSKITGLGDGTDIGDAATYGQLTAWTPHILVLGAADPVPGGTPANTVIMRTP